MKLITKMYTALELYRNLSARTITQNIDVTSLGTAATLLSGYAPVIRNVVYFTDRTVRKAWT